MKLAGPLLPLCARALSLVAALASPAWAAEEGGIVQLPPTTVERLIINHPQGGLVVRGWDRPEVAIAFRKYAPSDAVLGLLRVQVDITDGVVRVRSGLELRGELRGLPQPDAGIDLTVDVPRGAPLLASTFSGPLTVSDLRSDVDVGSQTGVVRVSNVSGAVRTHTGRGDQWLRAISGDVQARGLLGELRLAAVAGASLNAEVVSGQIAAEGVRSQVVRLRVATGTIYLFGPLMPTARYDLAVEEGDVQVALPTGTTPPRFSLSAVAQKLQIGFPLVPTPSPQSPKTAPGLTQGTVGGGGPLLQLRSGTGRVSVLPP